MCNNLKRSKTNKFSINLRAKSEIKHFLKMQKIAMLLR